MRKFKIILALLVFTMSFNLFAFNDVYKDKVIGSTTNHYLGKYDFEKYKILLGMFIDIDDMSNEKLFLVKDLLGVFIQVSETVKEKIKPKDINITIPYIRYFFDTDISIGENLQYIYQNNFSIDDLQKFLSITAKIDKLHEKKILTDLTVGANEIYKHLKYSNSDYIQYSFYSYYVLRVKFNKSKINGNNIIIMRNIFKSLKNDTDIQFFLDYCKMKNINISYKYLSIDPGKEKYMVLQEFIKDNINNDIIGPEYANNKIIFLKIIKKSCEIPEHDIDIKTQHFFIGKDLDSDNIFELGIRSFNVDRLKRMGNKFDYKNKSIFSKHYRIDYFNKHDDDSTVYENIKNLSKNNFSSILEFDDGWHLFKVVGREYTVTSTAYKALYDLILAQKVVLAKKNYARKTYGTFFKKYF